ncbi:hypothetical protein ACFL6Y_08065 [Elusimicrobiota bacterium]
MPITLHPYECRLIAEDYCNLTHNLTHMVKKESAGGWGMDGVWADDFHHQARVMLAGDRDGYYIDFSGSPADLAQTIRQGWFFKGQESAYFGGPRGSDPSGLAPEKFVFFMQNHDQVGNRAMGERLNHQIDLAGYNALNALLIFLPNTPLLFMGQEWAASSPFLYFADLSPQMGKLITQGRRDEFREFSAFTDPEARDRIPDPQDISTFERSRLNWREAGLDPHTSVLRFYKRMLGLRAQQGRESGEINGKFEITLFASSTMVIERIAGDALYVGIFCLGPGGCADLTECSGVNKIGPTQWEVVVTSEDRDFSLEPRPVKIDFAGTCPKIIFSRCGAVILRSSRIDPVLYGRI